MRFESTTVEGALSVHLELRGDDRGFFARAFCAEEFSAAGLGTQFVQANVSRSREAGTLRGMHYQRPPHAEAKLVRCTAGALLDVVVDLRPDSPTFGRSAAVELTARNHVALYVPTGCAHGFLTLEPETEAYYLVSAAYAPSSERGLRYDDPWAAIAWPNAPTVLSDKDRQWPDFDPDGFEAAALAGLLHQAVT